MKKIILGLFVLFSISAGAASVEYDVKGITWCNGVYIGAPYPQNCAYNEKWYGVQIKSIKKIIVKAPTLPDSVQILIIKDSLGHVWKANFDKCQLPGSNCDAGGTINENGDADIDFRGFAVNKPQHDLTLKITGTRLDLNLNVSGTMVFEVSKK